MELIDDNVFLSSMTEDLEVGELNEFSEEKYGYDEQVLEQLGQFF